MSLPRKDIHRKATQRTHTHHRGTHNRGTHHRGTLNKVTLLKGTLPNMVLHPLNNNSNNLVALALWKDVWLHCAVAVSWMHASDDGLAAEIDATSMVL